MEILKLKKIYDNNIDFNDYIRLLICKDESTYMFPNINFDDLKLNNLINFELKLTKKGEELLNKCDEPVKTNINFDKLHEKLQNKLLVLTGKKQKVLQGRYSFLINKQDLQTKLLKVSKKYKLNDWDKIEKLLLQYIDKCNEANWQFVNLIEYYIEKNNASKLVSDYNNYEEKEEIEKIIEPKQIKDLF